MAACPVCLPRNPHPPSSAKTAAPLLYSGVVNSPRTARFVLAFASVAATLGCTQLPAQKATPVYGYQVVNTFPHSTGSYTEGFLFLDGLFYEGTGINGHSALLAAAPSTGKPVQQHEIAPKYFGEGIVDWGANLYQWTWQTHTGFVYDRFTFRPLRQFTYTGEGWGMTHDKTSIITSDGTATLRFRDPATFKETRHITVHDGAKPIDQLNELEYVKGEIYSQRLARRPHRPHLPARRQGPRLDRPSPASCQTPSASTPNPSSTASPTTARTTASSSRASSGPPSLKSGSCRKPVTRLAAFAS